MENQLPTTNQQSEECHLVQQSQIQRAGVNLNQIEDFCKKSNKLFLTDAYSISKIKDRLNEPLIEDFIGIILGKISALGGFKNEIDSIVKDDILKMIFSQFKELSVEEIYKAFELERYNAYDTKTEHFQLFDANYISSVLKKYKNWKSEQKRVLNISAPKEVMELTAEEKEAKIISGINFKFSEYIETKEVSSPFVWVFDELVHRKILKMPTSETPKLSEYYNSKLQQARTELLTEQKKVQPKDANERKNIKLEIEKILNYKSEKTEVRAKRIVLVEFFNKQIELNKTEIL